jgi:hypothetical protein
MNDGLPRLRPGELVLLAIATATLGYFPWVLTVIIITKLLGV